MSNTTTLLPWHKPYWETLQHYFLQQRIPQALLVSGNPGLGKYQLALHFAAALLCESRTPEHFACGTCHSCLLFNAETHPDFMPVQPEASGKSIGIELIRQLLPKLALKPQYSGFRVVLINAADWLNTAAANAFLKCLEEPNERTVILLVCTQTGRLPATIISRCQKITVTSPPQTLATAWLLQQQVSADVPLLLTMAQGAPLLALEHAKADTISLRTSCFNDWLSIARQQSNPVIVAEQWQKLPIEPLLHWVCSWVIDFIKSHYNVQRSHFCNPDLQQTLQDFQKQLDLTALFALYDAVLATQKQIHTQLNKQLLFEVILIHWSNLNSGENDYG